MPPFVYDLTVEHESRVPTGINMFSPTFRGGNIGLSLCASINWNFIAEEAILIGFTRYAPIEYTVVGYSFQK